MKTTGSTLGTKFAALMVAVGVLLAGIFFFSHGAVSAVGGHWKTFETEVAERRNLLSDLKSQFGFGGLIHSFKNQVLRNESKYVDTLNARQTRIAELVAAYREIPRLSNEELLALGGIEAVAAEYRIMQDRVTTMFAQGNTVAEIDAAVAVDDVPALAAFDKLHSYSLQLTERHQEKITGSISSAVITLIVALGLALTAKAMKGDRQRCIDAGASDYITKPVDTEQLLSMLRVWLYAESR